MGEIAKRLHEVPATGLHCCAWISLGGGGDWQSGGCRNGGRRGESQQGAEGAQAGFQFVARARVRRCDGTGSGGSALSVAESQGGGGSVFKAAGTDAAYEAG